MTTATTIPPKRVSPDSRYSRLYNARDYARRKGRKPLTPEQHAELMKVVAEFTNL